MFVWSHARAAVESAGTELTSFGVRKSRAPSGARRCAPRSARSSPRRRRPAGPRRGRGRRRPGERARTSPPFPVHVDLRRIRGGLEPARSAFWTSCETSRPSVACCWTRISTAVLRTPPRSAGSRFRRDSPTGEPGGCGRCRGARRTDGDLRAAGEVDSELQALLHEDREQPDGDEQPGSADRDPLVPEKVDVGLTEKFHGCLSLTYLDRKSVDVLAAPVHRARRSCGRRRRR